MVKSEKKTTELVWLRLRGYRVASLKPEFDEHAIELERATHEGIPAYPDSVREDFYDVVLEGGWSYIHVYRDGHVVYLVAHSPSTFNSFSTEGSGRAQSQFYNHARVS
jgi:hypothetical protein